MEQEVLSVFATDSIDKLGLSVRVSHTLKRAGITIIGRLLQGQRSGQYSSLRGFGPKTIAEIEERLSRVQLVGQPEPADVSLPSEPSINYVPVPVIPGDVIQWQLQLIERQVSGGLLHEQARSAGDTVEHWLSVADATERREVFEILGRILGVSINICDELSRLLECVSKRDREILLLRYGPAPKTLKDIGTSSGLTRERVRQILVRLRRAVRKAWTAEARTLRIQSALLIARDMGLDITYQNWSQQIYRSGLVGDWVSDEHKESEPVETMVAVCNLLREDNIDELEIPENLAYAIQLAADGTPTLPARTVHVLATLPRKTRRRINRHARHSGGVHARWMSEELGIEYADMEEILEALGYRAVSEDWFIHKPPAGAYEVTRYDVFHRALRKMFLFCGPLDLDDICAGIRQAQSRPKEGFPTPPRQVMDQILQTYNYTCEDGLYYWSGETDENLSESEDLILDCIKKRGPVVHHSELAQAFFDSHLSFPSLHARLNCSPLFDQIDRALYKLRGQAVSYQDTERARAAAERIPVDLEVEYDTRGNIAVHATLSRLAIGTGVVFSDQFHDLTGEWKMGGEKLVATENELRGLQRRFESLGCQPGGRVMFVFNAWERTVTIEKADYEHTD